VPRLALTPLAVGATLLLAIACGERNAPAPTKEEAKAAEPAAGPEPAATREPAAPAFEAGFAVIRGGAPIYLTANRDGKHVTLRRDSTKAPPQDHPRGVVGSIVGEDDGLVTLDLMGTSAAGHHCADRPSAIEDFRLRVHVDASDLLPVTTRRVEQEFSDGTKVTLSAGVPLRADGEQYLASARNLALRLPVPADAVSDRYQPGTAFSNEDALGRVWRPEGLRYDGVRALPHEDLLPTGSIVSYYAKESLAAGPAVPWRDDLLGRRHERGSRRRQSRVLRCAARGRRPAVFSHRLRPSCSARVGPVLRRG
jgi:hypothetical protein